MHKLLLTRLQSTMTCASAPSSQRVPRGRRGSPSSPPGEETSQDASGSSARPAAFADLQRNVSARCVAWGLLLCAVLSSFNAWIETFANVHFLGGVHLPFGAVFVLMIVLGVNVLLRKINLHFARPLARGELITIYAMTLLAALISTPGTENFFLSAGPTLFYFSTRENRWTDFFYEHIPSWWAPGWNGQTFQSDVIEKFFTGQISLGQIPWHAWVVMLIAWSLFCGLLYGVLFFTALLLRRQWIESEALSFPLIQLPLQMVETDNQYSSSQQGFWTNRLMWIGFALAAGYHLLRGMNHYSPSWPTVMGFQGNPVSLALTEAPLSAIEVLNIEWYFGAIGIAYLLTREMSFSFWTGFFVVQLQLVVAAQLGFAPEILPKEPYAQRPHFLAFQALGAWVGMAGLLLWTARAHLKETWLIAWSTKGNIQDRNTQNPVSHEPFHPRTMWIGWFTCLLGLCAWCIFAGLSPWLSLGLFLSFVLLNIVLGRLVVEGGVLFPQLAFSPLYMLTKSVLPASALGEANLAKLSFLSPMLFGDSRTTTLPAFLHAFKMAHAADFSPRDTRSLALAVLAAVALSFSVTVITALGTVHQNSGLTGYTWFTYIGPQMSFNSTVGMLSTAQSLDSSTWPWIGVGIAIVLGLTAMRSRFLWFSLHPLGYVFATAQPLRRLWFSIFLGWLVKTCLTKYGGNEAAQNFRPFMIGLIFGNICAMVFWMIVGFFLGSQISYWPA